MTLKWFHIVFITLSMLLSLGMGVWGFVNHHLVLGAVSLMGSAALCVYAPYFVRKARSL